MELHKLDFWNIDGIEISSLIPIYFIDKNSHAAVLHNGNVFTRRYYR